MALGRRGTTRTTGAIQATAVSLSEVLIVVTVLVLLLTLLIPSLNFAREMVRRVVCANNLRQWGIAQHSYRNDHNDYLPTEGTYRHLDDPRTWYNNLPSYLGLPPYVEFEGANIAIRELPSIHVWICPSKNLTDAYKSGTGMNQFHYGMNQVLDGMGEEENPSPDTPDFPDQGGDPLRAHLFSAEPFTVFMFDIAPNSPAGSPRNVATEHARDWQGKRVGKFHGDYANFLYLSGSVAGFKTADLVTNNDLRHGDIIWDHPRLYWGYRPPAP